MGRPRKTTGKSEAAETQNPPAAAQKWGVSVAVEEFAGQVAGLTPDSPLELYIYRLWPLIDRKLSDPDNPKYIEKLPAYQTAPDVLAWLKKRWGSGKYQLRLNDPLAGRGSAQVAQARVEVVDPDFPPVVHHQEVLEVKDNQSYIEGQKVRGLWRKETMNQDQSAASVAVERLSETVSELVGKVTADKPAPAADETGQMAKLLGLVELLDKRRPDTFELVAKVREMLAPPDNTQLFKVMMENQAAMMRLLLERGQAAAAPADPVEQLEKAASLLERFGGGGGGGGSIVRDLLAALPAVAAAWGQTMAMARAAAPAAPHDGGPGLMPAPVAPPVMPAAAPVASAPGLAAGLPPEVARLLELGQRAMRAFARGVSGDDFAAGLVALEDDGEEVYLQLAGLGRQGILDALKASPHWPGLAPREAELAAWLDEFVSYGTEDAPTGGQAGQEGGQA